MALCHGRFWRQQAAGHVLSMVAQHWLWWRWVTRLVASWVAHWQQQHALAGTAVHGRGFGSPVCCAHGGSRLMGCTYAAWQSIDTPCYGHYCRYFAADQQLAVQHLGVSGLEPACPLFGPCLDLTAGNCGIHVCDILGCNRQQCLKQPRLFTMPSIDLQYPSSGGEAGPSACAAVLMR